MAATRRGHGNGNDESRARNTGAQRETLQLPSVQMNASEEDENANPQKRRRVSKACERCRQAKLKCNGAMPQCETCLEAKKPCTYGTTMRRRGLRTGYVRALECLWGLVFQSIKGSEKTVENLIAKNASKTFWVRDDLRDGSKADESPLETWKLSNIPQVIDALLDDDDQTTGLSHLSTQTQDAAITWSLLDPTSSSSQRSQHHNSKQAVCQRCRGEVPEQNWEPSGSAAAGRDQIRVKAHSTSNQTAQAESSELPPNPQKLLDQYFNLTHSWFPIVERHTVYRSLFAYRRKQALNNVEDANSGENAVLWAIFAFATMMYDGDDRGHSPTRKPTIPPDELYLIARNSIPLEKEDKYSVGHVQALLILGLFHYASCQWNIAQTVIGQAILLSSHIGLDQRDKCQTDCHRRIWLGCFVLDTLTSANSRKNPRTRSHHVHAFLPIDEAYNEEWEPWHLQEALLPGVGAEMAEVAAPTHALSVFNKLLEILCIANDWMCSATADPGDGCRQAFKSWDEGLPEHIRTLYGVDTSTTASMSPPLNILNLQMVHAFLSMKFTSSASQRLPMGVGRGQEWQRLISAMEEVFRRFDQRAIPPSFNLLRNVLPQSLAKNGTTSELIIELKNGIYNLESIQQSQSQSHNQILLENEHLGIARITQHASETWPLANSHLPNDFDISQPLKDHNLDEMNTVTMTYNLDPRIEQNFDSFMDISGSWSNMTPDILMEAQHGPPEHPSSQQGQSTIMAGDSGRITSHEAFPADAELGRFNDWDDLEM